jgi:acyl-coenzyme A thioesterase PaaI-like protein
MTDIIIQDYYPDGSAICYGCGRNNPEGLSIQTHWNGKEGLLRYQPLPHHTAFPGYVYGGLIASLMDCHSIGTAIAAAYQAEDRMPGTAPEITFVTGQMDITYHHPTPIDAELVLRARILEQTERKSIVHCTLHVEKKSVDGGLNQDDNRVYALGKIIAVRVPSRLDVDGWSGEK